MKPLVRANMTGQWSVMLLLLSIVLLPSATVLWLTKIAVRNQRVAMQQEIAKAYRQQLDLAVDRVNQHWTGIADRIETMAQQRTGSELFDACVQTGFADGILILGPTGREYPTVSYPAKPPTEMWNQDAWAAANQLEFVHRQFAIAADAYKAIAGVEPVVSEEARAWLAHVRCLEKSGEHKRAMDVLSNVFDRTPFTRMLDENRRSHWLTAQIRLLQLMHANNVDSTARATAVRKALNDSTWRLSPSQRLFAMDQMTELLPDEQQFSTQEALRFSLQLAENFASSTSPGIWNLGNDSRCVVLSNAPVALLFKDDTLQQQVDSVLASWENDDHEITLSASSGSPPENAIASRMLEGLPGRSLALSIKNPNVLGTQSGKYAALYTLTGIMTIGAVGVLAIVIGLFVRHQLKLAQLKNDLAAVVSHELRTPLASVRVLVDTLLSSDGVEQTGTQRLEYLQMISAENERLSRLIDNFLTFSRVQRGNQTLAFQQIQPAELAKRAIDVCGNKLDDTRFSACIEPGLSPVMADPDAIVSVLANLLDNACKFSGDQEEIQLVVQRHEDSVRFSVRDNGIGMTPREMRRAFQRFYQADSRLARAHGGCGIGLSLVQSIVKAHGSQVHLESAVDQGSDFSFCLPCVCESTTPAMRESAPVDDSIISS